MNNLWPVQQAIYSALTTAPATYPVYDAVPQSADRPYIVIGEVDAVPDEELADSSTDAAFTIHTWSASPGKAQSYAMLEFIRARLDGQTISGAWACTEDQFDVFEDRASTAASRLYHGFARYRVRVG